MTMPSYPDKNDSPDNGDITATNPPYVESSDNSSASSISVMGAAKRFFTQVLNYTDNDSRAVFWKAQLFLFIINIVMVVPLMYFSLIPSPGTRFDTMMMIVWIFYFLFWMAMLIPMIASVVRRFRDANIPLFALITWIIPFVGGLIIYILCLFPTKKTVYGNTIQTPINDM